MQEEWKMWNKFLVWIGLRLSEEDRKFLNSIHKPEEIIIGSRGSLRRQRKTNENYRNRERKY